MPTKRLIVSEILALDESAGSGEDGLHMPRFGVYLALGGKSFMLFVVVSRAACFAVSLWLAVFGGAGWPARRVFVR